MTSRIAVLPRLLFIIAGACLLIAAITVTGSNVLGAPASAWGYGGFAAAALGFAAAAS